MATNKNFKTLKLDSLSATQMYTGEIVCNGKGEFVGIAGTPGVPNIKPTSNNLPTQPSLPQYGISSKIFAEGTSFPMIRFDPADTHHPKGHIHFGTETAVKELTSNEAADIFANAYINELLRKLTNDKEG